MIEFTKKEVENYYTVHKGIQKNAQVIYGDTDSVMVDFGATTVQDAMELGKQRKDMQDCCGRTQENGTRWTVKGLKL